MEFPHELKATFGVGNLVTVVDRRDLFDGGGRPDPDLSAVGSARPPTRE